MSRALDIAVALLLIAGGLVLALAFPDLELLVFEGRPLGVVLVVIGALDLGWAVFGRKDRTPS